jgi:hypothetical protein
MALIGKYRLNGRKATRALTKIGVIDETHVMTVIVPLRSTPAVPFYLK